MYQTLSVKLKRLRSMYIFSQLFFLNYFKTDAGRKIWKSKIVKCPKTVRGI